MHTDDDGASSEAHRSWAEGADGYDFAVFDNMAFHDRKDWWELTAYCIICPNIIKIKKLWQGCTNFSVIWNRILNF